jgi:L-gulonate 5-dehydrogenase
MYAAVTAGVCQVELVNRPAPVLGSGQVLVEVDQVGLCGTDGHIWAGAYPAKPLPLVQGHEIAGRIISSTDDVSGRAEGTPVVIEPVIPCGRCHACRKGRANACRQMIVLGVHDDGGLCEVIAVAADRAHPAEDVPQAVAPLVEPASIALQAVARSAGASGDRALVLGCGPIGLLAIVALRERGVRVAAADLVSGRTRTAERFGAELTHVVDRESGYPSTAQRQELSEWSEGEGPGVVIEATGAPASLEAAVDLVASAGRVVAVGISEARARLSMKTLPYKELDLLGSRNSNHIFPTAIDFVRRNGALLEGLVSHRFTLAETQSALELAHAPGDDVRKIVISVGEGR